MRKSMLFAAFFAATLASVVQAAPIVIGTDQGLVSPGRDNQGWWSDTNANTNPTNDNYIIRTNVGAGIYDTRSYFTFDLSGLAPATVTSAVLRLRRYDQVGSPTITFYDVSTSATDLARRNILDVSVFDDLGTGTSYGAFTPAAGDSFDVLEFSLNASALGDISAAIGGYFSIGGAVDVGALFSSSGAEPGNGGPGYTQELVIDTSAAVVPLPAPALLLITGFAGLAAVRRKRSKV